MSEVEVGDFSAPLGSVTEGRLEFRRGASGVVIHTEQGDHLYRAHFEGRMPEIRVRGGTVAIEYSRLQAASAALFDRGPKSDLTLNASIPWQVRVHGGLSELTADLSGVELRYLEVRGGISHARLALGRPVGTVRIRVLGGASDLTIRRPRTVVTSFSVRGGVSRLALDEQRFGAIGGPVRLQSPDSEAAADRYEVEIRGGASGVTIEAA